MSSTFLKSLEVENYGGFYDTAKIVFDKRLSVVVLGASQGKSTLVNALDYLSEAILEGNIRNRWLNFCRTYVNRPKNFIRIEIILEINDSNHRSDYRYGICVTDIGVLSEYLYKENTGRRIFYRFKSEVDLAGISPEVAENVKSALIVDKPILHILKDHGVGIPAYFIRFFQRLWIIRAGGLNYSFSSTHLFKNSFFNKRANADKCCSFMRIFDKTVTDIIRVPNSSKIIVSHRNTDGYEYPVPLSRESNTFLKFLSLFRTFDALSAYGGTVIWDAGELEISYIDAERFRKSMPDGVFMVLFTSNDNLKVIFDQ